MTTNEDQARGGIVRAQRLTPEERRAIASNAARSRWKAEKGASILPRETHTGKLQVGGREIACSVLDNGLRVFSGRGLYSVMEASRRGGKREPVEGGARLPSFLDAQRVKDFITEDLMLALISPIQYHPKSGAVAFGYEATLLPKICNAILDARKAGRLTQRQMKMADAAELLIRGFAEVGVIALVDEATGYQEERAKDELQRILEAYIAPELMPWTRMFSDEFFRQVYRIHGWPYRPGMAKRTPYVGKLINKYVYEQLPPGVLAELRQKNPVTDTGHRKHRHYQFLTGDTGIPHLDKQIASITMLMRISDDPKEFEDNFKKAFAPVYQQRLPLVIEVTAEDKLTITDGAPE
jgi:hypothetical protein